MLGSKRFEVAILAVMAVAVIAVAALLLLNRAGIVEGGASPAYASRLFDDGKVHQVDIVIEDWEGFLSNATAEEYSSCDLTIDGEAFESVGIRAKGNNSKNLVSKYGLDRYSLKLEFDHYVAGGSYHGLDKMSLDASFQDNAYMKNYLAYDMMRYMDVPAPLCSYVWVTVNGDPWGLFLAVEEPEEAFARRNFGADHGNLYKPDYARLEDENADVALCYIDDDPDSYDNIFRTERFESGRADHMRVVQALKTLDSGENLGSAVFLEQTIDYFVVQSFVVNLDSYLGRTGHNYLLYEEDGRIAMLPWDYNLAFSTYMLGMPEPIDDPDVAVNYPIDTPAPGEYMLNRPLFHKLMQNGECFERYHERYGDFIDGYFASGRYEARIAETARMIAPYVQKDPTAFCSFEDHQRAVETLTEFCRLRAESVRGQLDGVLPSSFAERERMSDAFVDASGIDLRDMGEVADLYTL